MKLFIQTRDGQPFEHPIFEDNFRAAFPDVDVDNLPQGFAKFTRIAPPVIGEYDVYEGVTYERDINGFADVHHVRPMTDDERIVKDRQLNAERNARMEWLKDNPLLGTDQPGDAPNVIG